MQLRQLQADDMLNLTVLDVAEPEPLSPGEQRVLEAATVATLRDDALAILDRRLALEHEIEQLDRQLAALPVRHRNAHTLADELRLSRGEPFVPPAPPRFLHALERAERARRAGGAESDQLAAATSVLGVAVPQDLTPADALSMLFDGSLQVEIARRASEQERLRAEREKAEAARVEREQEEAKRYQHELREVLLLDDQRARDAALAQQQEHAARERAAIEADAARRLAERQAVHERFEREVAGTPAEERPGH